jgi:hypothetical protein
MAAYTIDHTKASLKGGNHGPNGWSFTLLSELAGEDAPYRGTLEAFARSHPHALVALPTWERDEDCVEGTLLWDGQPVEIYFEAMVLSFLTFWSSDRAVIESLKTEFLKCV